MKSSTKRIIIKGTVLTTALNGFVLFTQYREHGFISIAVWYKVGIFFAASMLFIIGAGMLLGSIEKPAETKAQRRFRVRNKVGK